MQFAYPFYFIVLLFIPLLLLLFLFLYKRRQKSLQSFAQPQSLPQLLPHYSIYRKLIKQALWLVAFFFLIITLTGPQWGYHFQEISRKGVDLFIVADVSNSMLAEDFKPNRLEQLKRKIRDLLKLSQGDRIGLVVFAGKAVVLCPLTLDYSAIEQFVEDLSVDLISIQGTNFAEAFSLVRQSFKDPKTSKAIFLITDGEDHSDALEKEMKELKERQIPLYILGVGTVQGAPIPLGKGEGGFKKDEAGNLVVSRLEENALSELALSSGGEYVRSVAGDEDLNTLYVKGLKGAMSSSEFKASKKKVFEHRYQWPLAFAFFFLFIEFFFSDYKKIGALFFFSFLFFHSQSLFAFNFKSLEEFQGAQSYKNKNYEEAQKHYQNNVVEDPKDAENSYNLGNVYYQKNQYQSASESYLKAAQNGAADLKGKALYNLGNSLYKLGELEKSIAAYEKALEINSKDEQTQLNLEFVKRKLKEKQQQEAQKKQEEKKSQDSQKQEDKKQSAQSSSQDQNQNQQQQEQKSEQQGQQQGSNQKQDSNQNQKESQEEQTRENKNAGQDQQQTQSADQKKQNKKNEDSKSKDIKNDKQSATSSAVQEAQKNNKSLQEAELWLGAIDENQSQILKNQIDKKLGHARRIKKDW